MQKKNRLASENLFWLVKSNLSPDTGLLSWNVSLEPWSLSQISQDYCQYMHASIFLSFLKTNDGKN